MLTLEYYGCELFIPVHVSCFLLVLVTCFVHLEERHTTIMVYFIHTAVDIDIIVKCKNANTNEQTSCCFDFSQLLFLLFTFVHFICLVAELLKDYLPGEGL